MSIKSNQNSLAGYKIVVMDDDYDVRELFQLNLERLGCETILAHNGNEVINLYNQSMVSGDKIDAIIMDLTIPGSMGGVELSEKLHSLNSNIKMIVSSGYSDAPEMVEFKKYGFDGAIDKIFDRDVIEKVLKQVLLSD